MIDGRDDRDCEVCRCRACGTIIRTRASSSTSSSTPTSLSLKDSSSSSSPQTSFTQSSSSSSADMNLFSQDEDSLVSSGSAVCKFSPDTKKEQKRTQRKAGGSTSSTSRVHNRLYAMSKSMQEAGREKRQQIAQSLAPKSHLPVKKISAKEASSLYDRLYVDGVQKQISMGRKKSVLIKQIV